MLGNANDFRLEFSDRPPIVPARVMKEENMTSSTASSASSASSPTEQKLPLSSLTAMVIGSMVGAGIFNLPGRFATATGPFGALIAWAIAGTGMYMLARVFQALAEKRPD